MRYSCESPRNGGNRGWKKKENNRGGQSKRAFSLVEVMVTVLVIGIVAGIVLAAAGGVQKKAARDQTKAEIRSLGVALERYKATHGAYPSAPSITNFYGQLTNVLTWRTNQIRGTGTNLTLLDPYGYPYRYRSPAVSSTTMLSDSFEIWSAGPNGRSDYDTGATNAGTNSLDDLTSWQ